MVIIGSSMSYGLWVPYDQMYFAIASGELGHSCNRPVDSQNLAAPALVPIYAYRRVEEALALKPDVVLYVVGPWDIEQKIDPKDLAERNLPAPTPSAPEENRKKDKSGIRRDLRFLAETALRDVGLDPAEIARNPWSHIRTVVMARHFFFQNTDLYLSTMFGDKDDYLRQPFTPAWQQRFADFDVVLGGMADKLRAAGVPLVVIPVPSRKEAALLSLHQMPQHIDPFAFGRRIELIASNHSATYVDLMEPFSRIPASESLYYVADGHPTSECQRVIAQSLVRKLQDGSIPAFSRCALQQTAEQGH
jgi:hypothetical protein